MGGIVLESARIEPSRALASGYRYRFESIDRAFDDLLTPLQGSTREKVSEQWVPHAPEEIWPFFCDEGNLEELTPGFLNFEVLGKSTREIGEGTLIDYRLKLNGIPMGWQSRIESWEPARRFVDTQVKGPYSYWRHAHEFIPLANGTLMRDVVRYRLPLGWLGSVVAGWKVEVAGRSDLLLPFDEDCRAIRELTGDPHPGACLFHHPHYVSILKESYVHPFHPFASCR